MSPALTFPRLFEGFCLAKQAAGVRDTTLSMYRVAYRALFDTLPNEAIADCRAITADHCIAWAAGMSSMATATRDQRIAKIKALFNWALAEGFTETNPAESLKRPRKDWQPDPMTPEEVEQLLRHAKIGRNAARNYAILCLMLDSGIRNSELCGLERGDLILRTGQITIRHTKGGLTRTIMVGKRTRDALWRWLAVAPEDAPALFVTEGNRPFSRTVLRRLVAIIAKRAGIRGRVYPHRLRHTFAILYLRNHGDPYTLQYMLGHTDMTVTRMYVKLAAQDVAETYRSPLDALQG